MDWLDTVHPIINPLRELKHWEEKTSNDHTKRDIDSDLPIFTSQ
jgi:hypothetical protein